MMETQKPLPEPLGFLPYMLSTDDPRPAREQFDANYKHGGGWQPFRGHTMGEGYTLHYPGDPPLYPVAAAQLRDELILIYPHAWVAVVQPDGSFEVCRMD